MGRSESNRNLVILGAGYVGSALAIAARGSGWAVSALTRNQDRIETLERLGIAAIQARTDEPGWESMMPTEVQGVVYCASSASRSVEGYRASYIDGQERALRWAQAAGVKHYIYTSSTSVYGEAMGEWVDEDSGPWSDTEYARVLLEAEKRVLSSAVRATVLRLAGLYGPGRHLLWDRVVEMVGDSLPGFGDTYLNLAHRDDCVSAILALLDCEREDSQLFNLADDQPFTRQGIVDWCCEQLGKPRLTFIPERASEDRRAARFASGRRPNRRICADRIKQALSWAPQYRDFRVGYRGMGLVD